MKVVPCTPCELAVFSPWIVKTCDPSSKFWRFFFSVPMESQGQSYVCGVRVCVIVFVASYLLLTRVPSTALLCRVGWMGQHPVAFRGNTRLRRLWRYARGPTLLTTTYALDVLIVPSTHRVSRLGVVFTKLLDVEQ